MKVETEYEYEKATRVVEVSFFTRHSCRNPIPVIKFDEYVDVAGEAGGYVNKRVEVKRLLGKTKSTLKYGNLLEVLFTGCVVC